jgi:hypothetical protein
LPQPNELALAVRALGREKFRLIGTLANHYIVAWLDKQMGAAHSGGQQTSLKIH